MAFKFVQFTTLLAAANAGIIVPHSYATSHQSILHHTAPINHIDSVHAAPIHHHVEHHAPANYEFSYSVYDEHTGDLKRQHEIRHGDEVRGQYSLVDSDGHHRIIDYHADRHTGLNRAVRHEPSHLKIVQPVYRTHHVVPVNHAPISHIAPNAHYSYYDGYLGSGHYSHY